MYPELLKIGPITLYSFGLMMGLAFIAANYFFTRETRRRKYDEVIPSTVTLIAMIGGIVGAKLFHLIENPSLLLRNPMGAIFSGDGLTFYGGLLTAIFCIWLYLRSKKISFLDIADSTAPSLILAYGIGRVGCQLAGDGDYGIPSSLPWAMSYPNGTFPTLSSVNIELANAYREMYPGTPVPYDITVHPTPVYEALSCFLIFGILMYLRKYVPTKPIGWLFSVYLMFAGLERFLVEFIRLNPLYVGLSQAQWISIALMITGAIMFIKRNNEQRQPT